MPLHVAIDMPSLELVRESARRGNERILIARAQRDLAAFDELYRRHLPAVYRYLYASLGNAEDAADLTQAVFVRALENLHRYRPGDAPFITWLMRIARNAAIDAHRRGHTNVPWQSVPDHLQPVAEGSPEGAAVRSEALAELRALVAHLPGEKQDLLALRFAGGLTAAEIASVVGKSEAAVKKQLSRTIASLREQYAT